MSSTIQSHDIAIYGGYLDDDDSLMQSASGGIATALAKKMIEEGGYVAGVAYSEDYHRAEYIVTNSKYDLDKLRGSKYIEADKKDIYKQVKKLLENGEKVLFIGLPCTVAAIYSFLGERTENLLTCELICLGPTSAKVHEEYVSYLENKYKSKIVDFSVRHKKDGWKPSYLYARFENGKKFEEPFYSTEYAFAFSLLGRESCYNCKFKGDFRRGDIMIGDFWGATEEDEFWNKKGVSVIFAETKKGNKEIESLQGVKLFRTTFEKAITRNPMVIKSRIKNPQREKFAKLFAEKGLMYAVKRCSGFKQRTRKAIAKCIPQPMRPLARKVYSFFSK